MQKKAEKKRSGLYPQDIAADQRGQNMNIIKGRKLSYEYQKLDEEGNVEEMIRAVDDVDLDVKAGDFVAILGHNGSGKSTLAKHLNAILIPTEGTL